MIKNKHSSILLLSFFTLITYVGKINAGCPVTDNPSQMFQCLTINPQAFIDLISKGDYKSFCHMANGYMTCMTTYVRDCLGGKAATGILEELQDLNLKCCISGRTQDCVVKNPALLQKCFAADNTVLLADGSTKPIIDIRLGDIVKSIDSTGELINTEIVSILHKNSNETTLFHSFYDENNKFISLTGDHLISLIGKGYVKASTVQIGDQLRIYSTEQKKFVEFVIKQINYELKSGFIAPLTSSGSILVNQIDSSCYAQINDHYLADIVMKPVKMWYHVKKFLNLNNDPVENGKNVDIGLYARILHKFTSTFMPSKLNV